jgi:hypothetical protein
VLGSQQICKQLHGDLASFSEMSQDADIDVIEHSDPDTKINSPNLSGSGGFSDDSQAGVNVSNDDGGGDDNDILFKENSC